MREKRIWTEGRCKKKKEEETGTETISTALKVFYIILNSVIIVLVLKQEAKERGFGTGSPQAGQSYLAKTGRISAEKAQAAATGIMIAVYAATAAALLFLGR